MVRWNIDSSSFSRFVPAILRQPGLRASPRLGSSDKRRQLELHHAPLNGSATCQPCRGPTDRQLWVFPVLIRLFASGFKAVTIFIWSFLLMAASERQRELRRRRHRKVKMAVLKRRAAKASSSEKEVLAAKVRRLTPGADQVIENLKLK
jgi:hypothetical protein